MFEFHYAGVLLHVNYTFTDCKTIHTTKTDKTSFKWFLKLLLVLKYSKKSRNINTQYIAAAHHNNYYPQIILCHNSYQLFYILHVLTKCKFVYDIFISISALLI